MIRFDMILLKDVEIQTDIADAGDAIDLAYSSDGVTYVLPLTAAEARLIASSLAHLADTLERRQGLI